MLEIWQKYSTSTVCIYFEVYKVREQQQIENSIEPVFKKLNRGSTFLLFSNTPEAVEFKDWDQRRERHRDNESCQPFRIPDIGTPRARFADTCAALGGRRHHSEPGAQKTNCSQLLLFSRKNKRSCLK